MTARHCGLSRTHRIELSENTRSFAASAEKKSGAAVVRRHCFEDVPQQLQIKIRGVSRGREDRRELTVHRKVVKLPPGPGLIARAPEMRPEAHLAGNADTDPLSIPCAPS